MRFIDNKKNSFSHIFSTNQGTVVGRFNKGVFETEDKELIKELKKRYSHVEVPKEPELTPPEKAEDVETKLDPSDFSTYKWEDLVALGSEKGIYKFGMNRLALEDALNELK